MMLLLFDAILHDMCIAGNQIKAAGDGAKAIAEALKVPRSLVTLNLRGEH